MEFNSILNLTLIIGAVIAVYAIYSIITDIIAAQADKQRQDASQSTVSEEDYARILNATRPLESDRRANRGEPFAEEEYIRRANTILDSTDFFKIAVSINER